MRHRHRRGLESCASSVKRCGFGCRCRGDGRWASCWEALAKAHQQRSSMIIEATWNGTSASVNGPMQRRSDLFTNSPPHNSLQSTEPFARTAPPHNHLFRLIHHRLSAREPIKYTSRCGHGFFQKKQMQAEIVSKCRVRGAQHADGDVKHKEAQMRKDSNRMCFCL